MSTDSFPPDYVGGDFYRERLGYPPLLFRTRVFSDGFIERYGYPTVSCDIYDASYGCNTDRIQRPPLKLDFFLFSKQFPFVNFAKIIRGWREMQQLPQLERKLVQSMYLRLLVLRFDQIYDDDKKLLIRGQHSSRLNSVEDVRSYMKGLFVDMVASIWSTDAGNYWQDLGDDLETDTRLDITTWTEAEAKTLVDTLRFPYTEAERAQIQDDWRCLRDERDEHSSNREWQREFLQRNCDARGITLSDLDPDEVPEQLRAGLEDPDEDVEDDKGIYDFDVQIDPEMKALYYQPGH